jgi:hypothetical protein
VASYAHAGSSPAFGTKISFPAKMKIAGLIEKAARARREILQGGFFADFPWTLCLLSKDP